MNAPAPLSQFPKISVIGDSTLVNGQLSINPKLTTAVSRGPRGRSGKDGVTTTTTNVVVYEPTSPLLMSASVETIDL